MSKRDDGGRRITPAECQACGGKGTYISSETVEAAFVTCPCPWCNGTGKDYAVVRERGKK